MRSGGPGPQGNVVEVYQGRVFHLMPRSSLAAIQLETAVEDGDKFVARKKSKKQRKQDPKPFDMDFYLLRHIVLQVAYVV